MRTKAKRQLKYDLVVAHSSAALAEQVNEAIGRGKIPVGGVTVTSFDVTIDGVTDTELVWAQAVSSYELAG